MVVNNPLIRPNFLGWGGIGGVGPLDFHDQWPVFQVTMVVKPMKFAIVVDNL